MLPLYSVAQARAIDRQAIEQQGVPGYELMTRAGEAAARLALARYPLAQRIVVLAGPGNNGGDGYVMARALLRAGRQVQLLTLDERLPQGDALQARRDWQQAGGAVAAFAGSLPPADLLVDALFGIGLTRAPTGSAAAAIDALNSAAAPVLALDLPSGLNADSGAAPGAVVRADLTLTFIVDKRGLHTGAAPACCGEIRLDSLQLPKAWLAMQQPVAGLLEHDHLRALLPPRSRDGHKGDYGHVLVVGGDAGYGGAVRLAGEGSARGGAGLTSVYTRPLHVLPLLAARPELMVHGGDQAAQAAALLARADVVVIGPGLGQEEWGRALWQQTLACTQPRVVDADALNLLARSPCALTPRDVITPHPGEAARLLGCSSAEVQADRYAALAALQQRHGCVVVLKGAGTLIGAPGQVPRVCPYGNPGMASGGSGDVLAGLIGALLAQGLPAMEAASAGVLAHALAGDRAARDGQRGMLAGDLLQALRGVLNPATGAGGGHGAG